MLESVFLAIHYTRPSAKVILEGNRAAPAIVALVQWQPRLRAGGPHRNPQGKFLPRLLRHSTVALALDLTPVRGGSPVTTTARPQGTRSEKHTQRGGNQRSRGYGDLTSIPRSRNARMKPFVSNCPIVSQAVVRRQKKKKHSHTRRPTHSISSSLSCCHSTDRSRPLKKWASSLRLVSRPGCSAIS